MVIHEVAFHDNDLLPQFFHGDESSEEAQSWWSYFKNYLAFQKTSDAENVQLWATALRQFTSLGGISSER